MGGAPTKLSTQQNIFSRLQIFLFGEQNYLVKRQDLIIDVRAEITERLKHCLHYGIREHPKPIKLRMELQPHQVKRSWGKEALSQSKSEIVPSDMSIMDVFNLEEVGGRFLVLGEPGSGKTTILLEIARQLTQISDENIESPVPVILNLSSWKDPNQSIIDWMKIELKKYRLSEAISKSFIENRKLIPLLDGLDEVEPKLQSLCIQAINEFTRGDLSSRYLVICCRHQQYSDTNKLLLLNNAVYLKKLTNQQVKNYLHDIKKSELWNSIKNDVYSVDLICNPFLLNIAILSYSSDSSKKWQAVNDTAHKYCRELLKVYIQDLLQISRTPYLLKILTLSYQDVSLKNLPGLVLASLRISYLLNLYIEKALKSIEKDDELYPEKVPSFEKTNRWLVWMAQKLEFELEYDFLIENLQPYWLLPNLGGSKVEQRDYVNVCTLSYMIAMQFGPFLHAVISTPNVYIKFGNLFVWRPLLVDFQLSVGIVLGTIFILRPIKTVDLVDFPALKIVFLLLFLFFIPQSVLDSTGKIILVYLLNGLIFFNLHKVEKDKKKRKVVNEGIWKSAVNAIGFGFFYGFVIFIGLWSTYNFYPLGVIDAFFAGLSQGIIVALITGGDTVIRHFALRFSLARHGRIPWRYKSFLDFATRHRLLQKVGGRYRFIHSLIQEHFAKLEV